MHIPVLQKEVTKYLDPEPNENFIDCTIGEAGHSLAILERTAPDGKVLGIDWSPEMIKNLGFRVKNLGLKNRIILVSDNFANLDRIVRQYNFHSVCGILFDLGMSSWHLEGSGRGFSFQKNEPFDMRYNQELETLTAEKIINKWPEKEIEDILKDYGQEKFAKRIAQEIARARKIKTIKTTFQLKEVIVRAIPGKFRHSKIHCATRTFQALRIAVNDELNNLKKALPQAVNTLNPGGKLIVISFHSLEDKIVKNFFKEYFEKGQLKILTKKPIRPREEEVEINPRSRSAKLRAAVKT